MDYRLCGNDKNENPAINGRAEGKKTPKRASGLNSAASSAISGLLAMTFLRFLDVPSKDKQAV
jgi:hypothetical protein